MDPWEGGETRFRIFVEVLSKESFMKILFINCVYKKGSTGKIIHDIRTSLELLNHKCLVAYGRGKKVNDGNAYKFCTEIEAKVHALFTRMGALQYSGSYLSTSRLINYIKKENPDVIHIHCINGYCVNIFKLLSFLGKEKYPTLVTHHAEFYYTGNCGHAFECLQFTSGRGCEKCPQRKNATGSMWRDTTSQSWKLMRESFHTFSPSLLKFVSVSPWLKERADMSPIVRDYDNIMVKNGVDTDIFHRYQLMGKEAKEIWPKTDKKVILHVTASFSDMPTSSKGGRFVVELARQLPQFLFIVVASSIDIHNELPSNVNIIGRVESQTVLAQLYSHADLVIITSQRETFSMVCAESLCCGTPVVGFKAGGPESIALPEFSEFIDYGDIDMLVRACQHMLSMKKNRDLISKSAMAEFDKGKMANNYLSIYQSLLKAK